MQRWIIGSAALLALVGLGALGPAPAAAAQRMVLSEEFTATW